MDNGSDCVTPCGEQGLHNGYYWCYVSEDTDEWDYCNPQSKGECFTIHFRGVVLLWAGGAGPLNIWLRL